MSIDQLRIELQKLRIIASACKVSEELTEGQRTACAIARDRCELVLQELQQLAGQK